MIILAKQGSEKIRKFYTTLLLIVPMMLGAKSALAVDPEAYGLDDLLDADVNLSSKDLKSSIAGIINVILGLLGVIAVIIVLLGGFKWMTSQGNTEKVDEAKKLIGAGVVGIVIVLAAFAIASFVLDELYNEVVV